MDGTQNMTSERAWTADEIDARLKEISARLGPHGYASLIIASYSGECSRATVLLEHRPGGTRSTVHCNATTIEAALALADERAAQIITPSDAWAIIGAEAA